MKQKAGLFYLPLTILKKISDELFEVFWNNNIIGIYNGAETNKVNSILQYALNNNGDKIVHEKIINKGNELFHDPTTAAILGNKLFVLANSYLGEYNANKESAKGISDQLGTVTIIVYELPNSTFSR